MQRQGRPRVVILNGPPAVGKTTVGRALAALVPNGVCVHGDDLRRFIVTRVDGEVELGLGYKNGATISANFVDAGYELVVFEYVFEHPRHVTAFLSHCSADADLYLFTLWASRSALSSRDAARRTEERQAAAPRTAYDSIKRNLPQLGRRVDVVAKSPDEIALEINDLCDSGEGLLASPRLDLGCAYE